MSRSVKDGAHTHRHDPGGSGLAVLLLSVVGLALAAEAARAIAVIVQALLIGLAAAVGLVIAGLITWLVIASRRYRPARLPLTQTRSWPTPAVMPAAADREVVSLRQAILELQAQLYGARAAALASRPPEVHQHLHVHGLDGEQLAALLAAAQDRQAGERW